MYHNLAALAEKWVYDPLGRVTSESMTISDQLQVLSTYSHIPDDNLLGWERRVDYPTGSVITEYIDLDGKLAGVDVEATQYGDDRYSSTSYRWLGDLYAGSTHGWADPRFNAPLREIARFDEFGRRTQWTYDPYHRDEQGNAVEGGPCGFPFDPQRCNDPLLDIEGVRDVMGRLRSVKSRFAYPRWSLPTFDPLPTNQPWEWRGYEYDRRSYFTGEWTATSTTEPVVGSIVPNAATNLDVQTTGGALAATPWVRERETEVGGLVSIYDGSDPNPDPIWFADPRADGHRLTRVDIDRASFAITHDESGRLTHGLDYDFVYDPRGRLAAAKDATGVVEVYLYDADGRLAYVHRPQSGESESYAYDGDRMVAAFDENAMTLWEAVWGPKQDQLVEWHDLSVDRWYTVLRDHRNSPVGTFDTWDFYMTETASYTPEGRLSVFAHDGTPSCTEPGDATEVCLGPSNLPFAFNSMWRSPVTGLTFMRNRWYSPRLGQFVTHDPLGYRDLFSLYGFAMFDPINGWDPFGMATRHFLSEAEPFTPACPPGTSCAGPGDPPPAFPCLEPGANCRPLESGIVEESEVQGDDLLPGKGAFSAVRALFKGVGEWVARKLGAKGVKELTEELAEEAITGPYGSITLKEIRRLLEFDSGKVKLFTRQTTAPQAGRKLSTAAGDEALAAAAGAERKLFSAEVPAALIDRLEQVGLAQRVTTQMGGVKGTEVVFHEGVTKYIAPLFREVAE